MTEPTTGIASQSGHWYTATGKPAYEIAAKAGHMRPVTLRDARKLNLFPSVTTVMSCAAKPALETWKVKQGILAALTLPRNPDENDDSFIARVLDDSKQQAIKAAARGTLIHEQIERAFLGKPVDDEFQSYVQPVISWLDEHFGNFPWSAERSFASTLGFGGKIDLCGPGVVVDFKTKDFTEDTLDKAKAYDEHGIQLAAYATGLGMTLDEVPIRVNLFVSSTVPGLIVPHTWEPQTFPRHWAMFKSLLDYWFADKQYKPVA